MQVEHLTLGGNIVIRETNDIDRIVIEAFRPFKILEGVRTIPLSNSKFEVKVTVGSKGALFDINKGRRLVTTNVCCFDQKHFLEMLAKISVIHQRIMPTVELA